MASLRISPPDACMFGTFRKDFQASTVNWTPNVGRTKAGGVQARPHPLGRRRYALIRCFANIYAKLPVNACRSTGAAATACAVVIPFGQRAPSTMLGSHLHAFELLYSSRLLIVLYSPNGVRVQTNTNGVQKPEGNDIPSGTNEYKRSTLEYKGVQTEHKTRWNSHPSGTNGVQTEYKRGTKGYKRVQTVWYVSQGF